MKKGLENRAKQRLNQAYQEKSAQLTKRRLRLEVIRCIKNRLIAKKWLAKKSPEEQRELMVRLERPKAVDKTMVISRYEQTFGQLLAKAKTQGEILDVVRTIWKEWKKGRVRPGPRSGPRSERRTPIWTAIAEWDIRHNQDSGVADYPFLTPWVDQKRSNDSVLKKHVQSIFPQLHVDTIRKHVKHWRLLHTPLSSITEAGWRWLTKHDRNAVRYIQQRLNQHSQDTTAINPPIENAGEISERIIRALHPR